MSKKKSHEQFCKEVYDLVKDEYEIKSNYKGANIKILIKHNICNCEYLVTPSNFLTGYRCPKCAGNLRYNTKTFKEKIYEIVQDEYIVLGEYINANTKILMKHNVCNYQWLAYPHSFINLNTRCPKCANVLPYTTETFKEKVYDLVKNEYSVLGKYKNAKTKILMKHNLCGHEFKMQPGNFLSGQRCPNCMGKRISEKLSKKHEQFINEVYELTKGKYQVIDLYINSYTKILMKHIECGFKWKIEPNLFLHGRRCPRCSESRGEKRIRCYLEENNIKFKPQYVFNDLLSDKGNYLRFDFGILDKNNNLQYLIEFDGRQHFKWIEDFINLQEFKKLQYHDQLKNDYCQKNNIQLVRIPYWEFGKIENILSKYNIEVVN